LLDLTGSPVAMRVFDDLLVLSAWRLSFPFQLRGFRAIATSLGVCQNLYRQFESISLRHAVWIAEKTLSISIENRKNCRNSALFGLKPDRRNGTIALHLYGRQSLFSGSLMSSPLSKAVLGEGNAIRNRRQGEGGLPFSGC
jgi:hypothetical protein